MTEHGDTPRDERHVVVDRRGEFLKYTDREAPASYPDFFHAMRGLMDLAVAADADDDAYRRAAEKIGEVAAILEPHREAVEAAGPAARTVDLPGRGSVLAPPWTLDERGPDGIGGTVRFSRFHVGGHAAAHGGAVAHLFDDLYGWVIEAAGLPIARTAYLKVDYRAVTPVDAPVRYAGRIDRVDGRKVFLVAELLDEEGSVLAESEALMVMLRPGAR
ncbi:MAG: hotdog domain-containing protein [Gordonia sp. (in: high G+C Gram-positive bacteria)]|uniref:hotdog domain-containing protein n=1 Tax=Gordonia sp. (in: high G+C Gram-positive bacteria) TaxID=84139 RepID=UPI0039E53A3D